MRSAGRPRKLPPAVFSLYFLLPAAALPGRTAGCLISLPVSVQNASRSSYLFPSRPD